MTEQNLIDAGFEKVIEKDEGYYYYVLYIGHLKENSLNLCLISCCDDDKLENGEWYVEIFDYEPFRFTSIEDLRELITVLNSNIKQQN